MPVTVERLRQRVARVQGDLRQGLASLGPLTRVHLVGITALAFATGALLFRDLLPGVLLPAAYLVIFVGLVAFGARTLWVLWPRTGRLSRVRRRFRWPVVVAVLLLGGWIPHLAAFLLAVAVGVFTVESIDRMARHLGTKVAPWMGHPLRFGWGFFALLVALLLAVAALHGLLGRLGDPLGVYDRLSVGYLLTYSVLTAVTLFVMGLVVAATLEIGTRDMPRRAFYAFAFYVPVAAYYGFVVGGLATDEFPWWAVILIAGLLLARLVRALYRVGRRAAGRFLPPGTTWDLLLALAFSILYVLAAGPQGDALLGARALRATSVTGLFLGVLAFPWLPRLRRAYERWRRERGLLRPA